MNLPLIEFENVSFRYEGEDADALCSVNFTIGKGEVIWITGESGSGKSTLLNLLNGMIPEVIEGNISGSILIEGKKDLPVYERSRILGNVFQNPRSQFFTTNTTAELVFAMENYGISKEEMRQRVKTITTEFQVEYLLDRDIFTLSSGERQLLALLTVLIMDPGIVVFDEPSANLDYGNAVRLGKEIDKLRQQGKTVLVADHRCFYLKGVVDRVFLLREKTLHVYDSVTQFAAAGYANRVLDLFDGVYPDRNDERERECIPDIRVEDVSYRDVLSHVSFTAGRGEVTVLIGVNGAGKTTLAGLISGSQKPDHGTIQTSGQPLYMLQDADYQLFGATCLKELEINSKDIRRNEDALCRLSIDTLKDNHPQTLSGGQKQRLQMAVCTVCENRVILLDEPTSGLDQGAMRRVVDEITQLKKDHTIVLISHDYELIRLAADRILYLNNRTIQNEFPLDREHLSQLNEIYKEMGAYYETSV